MKISPRIVVPATAVVAVAIFLASGCAGPGSSDPLVEPARSGSPVTAPRSAKSQNPAVQRPIEAFDGLVQTSQGRMHLTCRGEGSETVVLMAGWGDSSEKWNAVDPVISRQTRVCSYDRPGIGGSDPQGSVQTFETQASGLHELLGVAGESGPYVLVGHSFGGPEAVTFASRYPSQVEGLVLVDASPATWPETVCSVDAYASLCQVMRDPTKDPERVDVFPAFERVANIRTLGDLPMTVVTAAHRSDSTLSPTDLARLDKAWAEGVQGWAGLSSVSRVVTVQKTGHYVQLDQPTEVVDAVTAMLP